MPCLDDNAVTAFVARRLSDAERARVMEHLDGCEVCLTITSAAACSTDLPAATAMTTATDATDATDARDARDASAIDALRATAPEDGRGADRDDAAGAAVDATVPLGALPPPTSRRWPRGQRIAGRYTLVSMIGEGAMGVVYLADDPQLDRKVALKIVRSGRLLHTDARARLSREARAMAQVKHPNVVTVYDAGELEDGVFIAMELVTGETLADWLGRARPWRDVVRVFEAAGRGLAAAHAAGIVHRDFKPENVLVDRDDRACVTDFGLAFAPAAAVATSAPELAGVALRDAGALTRTGALVGTPLYMSPEQHRGERVDARSDQYSFAVALHLALYGTVPFGGATVGELRSSVLDGRVPRRPSGTPVPARVHRVLARALAARPDARFPSIDRLLAELAAAARPVWRRRGVAAIGAGMAACAAAGMLVLAMAREPAAAIVPGVSAPAGVPAKPRRIALLFEPFDNQTRVPEIDGALETAIVATLYRSTGIDPFAGVELQQLTVGLAGHAASLDAVGRAFTARDGNTVLAFTGTIARAGTGFAITLTGRDTAAARLPFLLRESAVTLDGVLPAALRLAVALRSRLGEPAPPDGDRVMSSSLAAVHELSIGKQLVVAGDLDGACAHLRRAVAADPALSEAHAQLGGALYNLSRVSEAATELERALDGRDRMPERLRLALLGDYYDTVGRYVDSVAAYEQLLAKWPGDVRTEINVVASAIDGGSWPLALELARRAVADHGNLAIARANLVLAELANGKLADAVHDGTAMIAELPRPTQFGFAFVAAAHALTGDPVAAAHALDQLAAFDPGFADDARVDLWLHEGRLADAEAVVRRQLAAAGKLATADAARGPLITLARVLLRRGDRAGARRAAAQAVGDPSVRNAYVVASILVDTGDDRVARELVRAWAGNAIAEWRMFGKTLEGDVARAHGDLRGAIAAYTDALRLGDVWIVHARLGLAQLAAGACGDAVRELGLCVARRGEAVVFQSPSLSYLPEVQLALARAKEGAHDPGALDAYREVLALAPAAQADPVTDAARRRVEALASHRP